MSKGKTIEILVRGVCIKGGKLLVCQGKKAGNTYLPGGHVEWRENAAEGLRREIEEELGVRPVIGDFLGAVEHTFIQKGERHCEINLMFGMEIPVFSSETDPESCEHWISFKWIPLSGLGRHRLEPWPLRKLIPAWMKDRSKTSRWGSTL